jgi:MSHA biogenesis protein MshQ
MLADMDGSDPFTKEATLSASVFLDERPSHAGHIFHICGKSGFSRDLDLHIEPDDRFHFYVASGAPYTVRSRTVIQPGKWYRVAAIYRANQEIAIYVDGVLETRRAIPGVERLPNVAPLSIGENIVFPGRKFRGRIDEVTFWSRALSGDEIAALWRAPSGHQGALRASFSFDGDAKDHSSSGLVGRFIGGARYLRPGAPRAPSGPATTKRGALPIDPDWDIGPPPLPP